MSEIRLRALGWDHDRCMRPMRACTAAYAKLEPEVCVDWDVRSLTAFGDQPLEEIADAYDLVFVDHPFCGTAEATGCLKPLDALLDETALGALAADTVGPSHGSYTYGGCQWGLATDAACQVSAVRDDLLDGDGAPASWDEALALARSRPGRVALPLSPPHAISSFLTLCAAQGAPAAQAPDGLADRDVAIRALETLHELARLGPIGAVEWEPPDVLARLTSTDDLVYVPLTYGFSGYAVVGNVERPCRFLDVPGARGAVLGGAGLAVTAASGKPEVAAAFAAWASGGEAQREIVARNGGQPGSRGAWDDAGLDRLAGSFYSGTRASIENAWVRPRDAWWPGFQLEGGEELTSSLAAREDPERSLERLEAAYRRHRT